MAKNVIILGAGASAAYGAPVMRTFLDSAEDLLASGGAVEHEESFRRVFQAVARLQVVHSKSELDLINLESVFTTLELAKTLGRFPGLSPVDIDQLIGDLKWVIVSTLQSRIAFPVRGVQPTGHPDLVSFVTAIAGSQRSRKTATTAILTFNYDILMDVALCNAGLGVDYGLGIEPNREECLPLLKLHGSLNWARKGDLVAPLYMVDYLRTRRLQFPDTQVVHTILPIADDLHAAPRQSQGGSENGYGPASVIVPPSWNKAEAHRGISLVWSRAAEELASATSIYVVGYSLPTTDTFFRQLYALGTAGGTPLKRFWVSDPDRSREAVFRSVLGPGARERFGFFEEFAGNAFQRIAEAVRVG